MRINCFKGIVTARSDTPYNVEAGLMSRAEQEGASEPESLDVTRNRRWIYRTEGREFAGRVSPPFPYSYRRPDLTWIGVEIGGGGGGGARSRVAAIGNRDL